MMHSWSHLVFSLFAPTSSSTTMKKNKTIHVTKLDILWKNTLRYYWHNDSKLQHQRNLLRWCVANNPNISWVTLDYFLCNFTRNSHTICRRCCVNSLLFFSIMSRLHQLKHITHLQSGPEEASRLRALVPAVGGAGVGGGAAAGPAADLQVLLSVKRVLAILGVSKRFDQVNLLPGLQKSTAERKRDSVACICTSPQSGWNK